MKNYINNARTDAILTIDIESSENLKEALRLSEVGNKDVYNTLAVGIGLNDIDVPAGKEICVSNNTVMSFVAVRSTPR